MFGYFLGCGFGNLLLCWKVEKIRPAGLLTFALASKACLGSLSWGILLTWTNHLNWDLSIPRSNGSMLRDFRISELLTLLNSVTSLILHKNFLWSHTFGHYPRFMIISENGDKNCFENWELCLFWEFLFHDNRVVQSSHYCTNLVYSGIEFFVLPSVTSKCNPKILELLYLLPCRFIHLQHAQIRVSWKMKYLSCDRAFFHSGGAAFICKAIWCALKTRFCEREQKQIISK